MRMSLPCVRRPSRSSYARADGDLQRAVGDGAEHLPGTPLELVPLGDVVRQRGTGEEQRAAGVQPLDVERRDLPAGRAEEHHRPARAQARQRGVEGVLADSVVDDVRARLAGGLAQRCGQVVRAAVVDHRVGAAGAHRLALLRPAGGADDPGTPGLEQLDEELADPTGRGVDDGDGALRRGIGARDEVVRGETLQRGGRSDVIGHSVGHQDEAGGSDGRVPGAGAGHHRPGDPVPDRDGVDPVAHGDDMTRALAAQDERGLTRVDALAQVDVDEVDPHGRHLDEGLSRPGVPRRPVLHLEHLGATVGRNDEGGSVQLAHAPRVRRRSARTSAAVTRGRSA
jgi:hypothetical protein